jgi:hypothetical protein
MSWHACKPTKAAVESGVEISGSMKVASVRLKGRRGLIP